MGQFCSELTGLQLVYSRLCSDCAVDGLSEVPSAGANSLIMRSFPQWQVLRR